MSERTVEVGVLGATGVVGQQLAMRLANHPWFRLVWLAAGQRSAGRTFGDLTWRLREPMPSGVRALVIDEAKPDRAPGVVFSALDAAVAGGIEAEFAGAGHIVVSNARNHRMDPLVPLLIPEVNPDHLTLLPEQKRARGWTGCIVTNPNCSTVVLALVLAALDRFGPRDVLVTTLQAVSGAGYPGVASLDILGNVIPFIGGEEEKLETETKKILGRIGASGVEPHPVAVSAQTTRVPVENGHTEMISIGFERSPREEDLLEALERFSGRPQQHGLPSAPCRPILFLHESDRPQPRIDADSGGGMTICVGRLRRCPVLDYKLVALGHNLVRGAAGAAILNAELMAAEGYLT